MTVSAIYEGTIRHRRFAVRPHEFSHRVALAYLDLGFDFNCAAMTTRAHKPGASQADVA